MAKKVEGYIKSQIPAGKATPAPPVGPALGQHGVNIVEFTKQFNARTADQGDLIIPVVITVIRGQKLWLRDKDSACSGIDQEGMQHQSGFCEAEQGEGGSSLQGKASGDRGVKDAGLKRSILRGGYEHDRRYCKKYGQQLKKKQHCHVPWQCSTRMQTQHSSQCIVTRVEWEGPLPI